MHRHQAKTPERGLNENLLCSTLSSYGYVELLGFKINLNELVIGVLYVVNELPIKVL